MHTADLTTHKSASDFLQQTQAALERREAANNLMLGVALRLQRFPERFKQTPYLATVTDAGALVFAAEMTPPYNLVVHGERDDCRVAMELVARNLDESKWDVPGVNGPVPLSEQFTAVWAPLVGTSYTPGMKMRIFELREVIWPKLSAGRFRPATLEEVDTVAQWMVAFQREAVPNDPPPDGIEFARTRIGDGDLFVWDDDGPVSMAARSRPTLTGGAVNLVYTPPELRGRGYASSCVAGLSQWLLDSGWKFCMLFTDLANPTSNALYQRLGYRPVCAFDEFVFAPPASP